MASDAPATDRLDLLMAVMPFAMIEAPMLGPAVLTAAVRERGLSVRTLHANLMLAERVGDELFVEGSNASSRWMVGERVFRPHAYPPGHAAEFDEPVELRTTHRKLHDALAPHIAPFLDDLVARVLALNPRILGLSSVFQQNLACSALAWRIKAAAPDIVIVMGGANVMAQMGEAIAEIWPWVDHFFSGEADTAFPDFCEKWVRDGVRPAERIVRCPPLWDMARSPMPAFDGYFEDLRAAQSAGHLPANLPSALMIETSRGCWWGAKNHCTFCGLNGETMAHREKPAERAIEEIDALEACWDVHEFWFADNIMPIRYLKELVPPLAERERPPEMFWEVKANLSDAQLALMARAGIGRIQPGIESLSTPILKLMRKGVSAHQNLVLLRNGRTHGVRILWNHLYGFPGETVESYEAVAALIPALEHLQPPSGLTPIMIDRFSPYFNEFESFGIRRIAPVAGYVGLYPRAARIDDIAYHFDGAYSTPLVENPELIGRLQRLIGEWRLRWMGKTLPMLSVVQRGRDSVAIADTRRIAVSPLVTIPAAAFGVLEACDRATTRDALRADAEHIDDLLARRFLVEHEGRLLNLVTHQADAPAFPQEATTGSDTVTA